MPSIVYCLIFLFLTNFFIEPTTCDLPTYLQNLELDDVTSLWDKFPSIINQIKQTINRFRCPKGWRRLGGSCYYLSNITSTPNEANYTCNLLHSNHSNLMQIRNTVELFYAAHVLTKNNLSGLMVEIDLTILKGKNITQFLLNDQGRWQRMKDKFREIRIKYYKLKDKVIRELDEAGLRISRRSKKIKQSVNKRKQKIVHDHIDADAYDYYDDYHEFNRTMIAFSNDTTQVDEYEYESIDSEEDVDEFERMDDIKGICDQIDWNVLDNNATVYLLTTFLIEDRIVCSLSNVEPDLEYDHVCEYVLDFCFANIVCGQHGRCVNTLSGFKCSCSFLYGGLLCERISKQGKQIIIGIILILILYGLSIKPVRWFLRFTITSCIRYCRYQRRKSKQQKENQNKSDKEQLVKQKKKEENDEETDAPIVIEQRRQTIAEEIMEFLLPRVYDPVRNPNKRDLIRVFWVGGLTIFFLTLLLSITTITHFTSYKYDVVNETKFDVLINNTVDLLNRCGTLSNYRTENLIFFPIALALILIFSWSIKREKRCRNVCDGRPGLIAPIEPFRTANRFTTATVFGILAFEVLKIFEELLFSAADPLNRGILIELLERVALVILIGLRYYPVLASLQLRNIAARFFVCPYLLADMIYTIIREGSCMGFLPLTRYYSALEEAKLRMELGTWFIVYGLIKNTPHFILLSYITAEVFVRFGYDSIYVPLKKKQSIWLAPMTQPDESAFAKYYVTKLFRRNRHNIEKMRYSTDVDIDQLDDFEYEQKLQREQNPSRVKKFLNFIYPWNDDFRFTAMATCTYAVAIVFLYYLACTMVFFYVSRTTGHISFIRYYIESTFNIEFKGFFSLRSTIVTSAMVTVAVFAFQLYLGMQNYKKHKLQLYKGIYEDVPSAGNFKPNSIAAKSVHYSGFLVGYMAWGFIICFHLIFFVLSIIHVLSLQIRYVEIILAVVVPVSVVYLLKMASASSVGTFFFIQDTEDKLNLKNRKVYAIFVYFNFFADCFLGIASCIIRLIKASFLNVVYMARLDCSFLGRPLERYDLGFAAYVSYLHMEVTHTNPIMLAFCYSLYDDVIQRRRKHCYDDECCIAPGELDDDDDDEIVIDEQKAKAKAKTKAIENTSSKTSTRSTNGSIGRKTKIEPSETRQSIGKKQKSVDTDDDDDDDQGLSIKKAKSRSPSVISEKNSQKSSKQKQPSIDKNLEEEEDDDDEEEGDADGGPATPEISTIARLIPEQQPRLPLPSAPIPTAPARQDLPPEEKDDDDDDDDNDKGDDDGGVKPPSISTISKIMPQELPRLLPMQRSSPPRVPKRQDSSDEKDKDDDEDEDDDGGMASKAASKPKQKAAKQKTKKQTVNDDDDDDDDDNEDDDGGVKPPSISTIAKVMPEQPPRLLPFQRTSPPPSAPQQASIPRPVAPPLAPTQGPTAPPLAPVLRPTAPPLAPVPRPTAPPFAPMQGPSAPQMISTVRPAAPMLPQAAARSLALPQQTSPPRVPQRQDIADDDDDGDDGGINPKVIAKQRQEMEKKKKQKEELKKKHQQLADDDYDDGGVDPKLIAKQRQEAQKKKKAKESKVPLVLDDEDDDGGLSKERQIAAQKTKRELEAQKKKKEEIKTKIKKDNDDEDDDGGISKEKYLAEQKKKQELEAQKKKKKEETKAKIKKDNDDEDDDGVPRREPSPKKTKPPKNVPKREILKEEDEDDDGGRVTKSYDTIKKMMPTHRPVLDHQNKKSPSPEATDDGSMLTSKSRQQQQQQQPLLKSYDTVGRIVPKVSLDYRKDKTESHYDTIPTDEERISRVNAVYSPPSYDKAAGTTNPNDLVLLRTISYREAQQSTPPLTQRRPKGPSSLRSQSNTNEDSSHYSEITNDTASSGIINRSYSNTGSIKSSSNHSIKQQNKQLSSEQTLKEQQTEESTIETEEEEEEDEEEEEEEEEEKEETDEEEEEEEEKKSTRLKLKPISKVSTAYSTISHLIRPDKARQLDEIVRQKRARFRWFLAYTIINNYHLFDLRKQVQSRLARLRIERSNLIDDQRQAATVAAVVSVETSEPSGIKQRKLKITPATPDVPVAPKQAPRVLAHLLSVPVPVIDDYPQSPAERYVAIRSSMLYDVNAQQLDIPRTPFTSQPPSTISQSARVQSKSGLSPRSLGFEPLPQVVIQAPSDGSLTSKGKRPAFHRQETADSTPIVINQQSGTPVFQPVPESTHSTDYPFANGSSVTNFSTLRTQMSHAQHMQAWRQNQLRKLQKKRPHCYHYGAPLQRPLEEKVATAAILTPQILSTDNNNQQLKKRVPSNSPFRYPHQVRTINEKQSKPTSSTTTTTTTTNKEDKGIKKKSLRTTTTTHRKDSHSSFSNMTEV